MWEYASLEFWRECVQDGLPSPHRCAPSLTWASGAAGVASSECYSATLRFLAEAPCVSKTQAICTLASVKLLRKWRMANPAQARERADKALDGFALRNAAVLAREEALPGVPAQVKESMRQALNHWLPQVELRPGRFGPGACAERLSHIARFTALGDWVALAGDSFPEYPVGHSHFDHVAARLCAVPKQFDKDRLITVEPAYGTWAQQAVRSTLLASIHNGPLRGSCMDLGWVDGPNIQRRLAREASKNGANATIDLKDASDNISWLDVVETFPSWVVALLESTRSTSYVDPRKKLQVNPLGLYAGMGNATTFVVETLFFSAYVVAWAQYFGQKPWVSTFGDDVICSSKVAQLIIEHGQSPCFVVNRDKSFLGNDYLRESCGIFALRGEDITVPRIDGFQDTWNGRLGAAQCLRDLEAIPELNGIVYRALQPRCLPNWPFFVEGYPSTSSCLSEYDEVPETRWNSLACQRECKVQVQEQGQQLVSTNTKEDINLVTFLKAMKPGSQYGTSGERLQSPFWWLYSSDRVVAGLYLASLTGQITVKDIHRVKDSKSRVIGHAVSVPDKDKVRTKARWRRIASEPQSALACHKVSVNGSGARVFETPLAYAASLLR